MQHVNVADEEDSDEELVIPTRREAKSMTQAEFRAALEATGFIGMWADRTDIKESVEFARELRRRAPNPHARVAVRVLDTDILIDVGRNYLPANQWITSQDITQFAVPGFVILELLQGCRNKREMQRSLRLISLFTVVWPDAAACDVAMGLCARYFLSHSLAPFDALIAATALSMDATLCTFNVKHFRPISKLQVEQPYRK